MSKTNIFKNSILPLFFYAFASSYGAQLTVTTNTDSGSVSFRSVIEKAASADTILFNIPKKDTITLKQTITFTKSLVLLGKNKGTGNDIVVQVDTPGVSRYRVFLIGVPGNESYNETVYMKNFILRGGYVTDGTLHGGKGAVIHFCGNLEMDSCSITEGICESKEARGGGIYTYRGDLLLSNCTVADNVSRMVLTSESEINNNIVVGGGGVYSYEGDITVKNSTIIGNIASILDKSGKVYGNIEGGGIAAHTGTISLVNSRITQNWATFLCLTKSSHYVNVYVNGGGVYTNRGEIHVTECTIEHNSANAADSSDVAEGATLNASGGGLYNYQGKSVVSNSTVIGNSTGISDVLGKTHASANGAGIYNYSGFLSLTNSTVIKNTAFSVTYPSSMRGFQSNNISGGAIYSYEGIVNIAYCTIIDNSVEEYTPFHNNVHGGGIWIYKAPCSILNTILLGNSLKSAKESLPSDFYAIEKDSAAAVNSIISSDTNLISNNCFKNITMKQVFGSDIPSLDNNGGKTFTISLQTKNSKAANTGIKAAFANPALLPFGNKSSSVKLAYFDGTVWRSVRGGSPLTGSSITKEISTDQRGKTRANPPCIGAFEFVSEDQVNTLRTDISNNSMIHELYLTNNKIYLTLGGITDARIEFFNLNGIKLYVKMLHNITEHSTISLPAIAKGPVICRVTSPSVSISKKFILTH